MKNLKLILFAVCTIVSFFAQAQVTVRGDADYFTKTSPWIQYIYPREREGALAELDHYMQFFRSKYDVSFRWKLDERLKLALLSNQNQFPNGFATPIPFLQTAHYPTGAAILDQFASDSFLFSLASHETAHLYQLSAKSELSSIVKSVLGNVLVFQSPILVPIFVFPNAVLPAFMLEGNAVLNESTWGRGGRLYSGEVRAQVISQVYGGKTGPSRLINQNADYPGGEDYLYGGYFFAYLGEKFGVDKTNQFYISHANREIWPYNINKTFRAHFKVSYTRLIHEYSQWLQPLVDRFQPAKGQILTHVFNRPVFNHDANHIYFVENPTGRVANALYRLNKSDVKFSQQTIDLPSDKTFFIDGQYYVSTFAQVDATNLKYGLYGEGLKPKPGTIDKMYQDIRGGHTLVVDANNSYQRAHLEKDGAFLDQAGSSSILDSSGRAYYFRQVADEHVMYRDREILFKYKGYYGFPTEVGPDGEIYFVASSPYGATLFRWKDGQIYRMFSADNVVEARLIRAGTFLVAANDSDGFQIQLLTADPRPEQPAWYNYKLPNVLPPAPPAQTTAAASTEGLRGEEKEYTPFRQLRYSGTNLVTNGGSGIVDLTLVDPLAWNLLSVGGKWTDERDAAFSAVYLNQRNRLGWMIAGVYDKDHKEKDNNVKYDVVQAQAFAALDYRLFKWRRWNSDIQLGPTWKEENSLVEELRQRYGVRANLILNYSRTDAGLAYQPYRYLNFMFTHHTEASENTGRKVDSLNGVEMNLGGDIFRQTFLDLSGSWALAEIDSIGVTYLRGQRISTFNIPTFLSDGKVKEVREFTAVLKQVVDLSYYFPRFPISLRRMAPFVAFKDTYTREQVESTRFPHWREELSLGTELELLVLHSGILRVAPSLSAIKLGGGGYDTEWRVNLGTAATF